MSKKKYKAPMPVGNFFPVPNEILQLGLCSGEILVYTYLMYCEDRTTFQCHPSYRTIGKAVGMSQNTVAKHVAGLIEKRLIYAKPTTVQTRKGKKCNGNLLYNDRFSGLRKEFPGQGNGGNPASDDPRRVCPDE